MGLALKNAFRSVVGHTSSLLPGAPAGKRKLYINLRDLGGIGGPLRFLSNLAFEIRRRNIAIQNWSLRGCTAALVFSASWGSSFARLGRSLGVKTVLRVDGFFTPELYGPGKPRALTDYRRLINDRLREDIAAFDHVVYQSAFSKERADLRLQARDKDYSIIHNGVDIGFLYPKPNATVRNPPRILILGKHYPENLSLALDVFTRVRSAIEAELIVVGPMRLGAVATHAVIADLVRNDALMRHITCLGPISYDLLPQTLAQGDLFLHVKIGDWCPNAVLEALSCGLPVVCPSFGGTKELVGEAGVVASCKGYEIDDNLRDGMTEGVMKVLTDYGNYSASARARAVTEFDRSAIATRYLKIMNLE